MSHEITNTNGRDEMAYIGEKPWHGLGQALREGAPIEEWIKAAGMDWKVHRSEIRYSTERGGNGLKNWSEKHVLFRSDTKAPLGVVSDRYKVVQPREVLEFFRDLAESNNLKLSTAGTLRGGAVYWALASMGMRAVIGPGDEMRAHILLSTSADGSRRTEAANIEERVVCANTLAMADAEDGAARVRVSHRSVFDADAVKDRLGKGVVAFEKMVADARMLATRRMAQRDVERFMCSLLTGKTPDLLTEEERNEAMAMRAAKAILDKYTGNGRGAMLNSSRNTAWGLVNAVTEYIDHDFPARSDDNRLTNAWFGNGSEMKSKAMAIALDMV